MSKAQKAKQINFMFFRLRGIKASLKTISEELKRLGFKSRVYAEIADARAHTQQAISLIKIERISND